MPQYDSSHTGEQVDEAVGITLGNKNKGSNVLPVYLNAYGEAVPVNKDTTPTQNSTNIVESGGVFTQLSTKLPYEWVQPAGVDWNGLIKVGTGVTITDGVASGFSTSSYLVSPNFLHLADKTWLFEFKINVSSVATQQRCVENNSNSQAIFLINLSNKHFLARFGNGSSWVSPEIIGATTLQDGEYTLRIEYTGSKINMYLNGVLDQSWTGTLNLPDFVLRMGLGRAGTNPVLGSIDLNAFSITVDGTTWKPYPDSLFPPSSGAVEEYVQGIMPTKQDLLISGDGISINNNVIGVNPDYRSITTIGEVDNKWEYFSKLDEGNGNDLVSTMEAAKRSTFDRSKYAIDRTPVITENGIASGFGPSYDLRIPNISFGTSNWEIRVSVYLDPNTFKNDVTEDIISYYYNSVLIRKETLYRISFRVNPNDAYDEGSINLYDRSKDTGLLYYIWGYSATKGYYLKKSYDGNVYTIIDTNSSTLPLYQPSARSIWIGKYWYGSLFSFVDGSVDLKKFVITIDGEEVFNGNKTGVDVLKPNNFSTTETPPTITTDGVASGFSTSKYIYKSDMHVQPRESMRFCGSYIWNYAASGPQSVFSYDTGSMRLEPTRTEFRLHGNIGGGAVDAAVIRFTSLPTLNNGERVYYDMTITKTKQYAKLVWGSMGTYEQTKEYTIYDEYFNFNRLNIGIYGGAPFQGSIDLNAFRVYADGDLVYQPCFKIPYTLTSQGNKIVDAKYKERLEIEEERLGYTPYDVLETKNTNNFGTAGAVQIVDGIASGFGGGKYLETKLPMNNVTNIRILARFMATSYAASSSEPSIMFSQGTNAYWGNKGITLNVTYSGYLQVGTPVGNFNVSKIDLNRYYEAEIVYNGTNLITYLDGEKVYDQAKSISINSTLLTIGGSFRDANNTHGYYFAGGFFDLDYFKIYSNGELVYSPYNKPYYELGTIKEANIVSTYVNGSNQVRRHANQFVKIQGTCTANTAVTFPNSTAFKDTDYFLSVPGTKTTTGFTPTVTGDWIAEGYVSL